MKFITFEGCDGSGKSTQVHLLHQWFINNGISCIATKEPGGTPLANKIRSILLTEEIEDPITEFILLSAARRDHVKNIIQPNLINNVTVICDRFLDSSLIYQGIQKRIDLNFMLNLHYKLVSGLMPSITFLLDVAPEITMQRLKNDGNRHLNFYDTKALSFHTTIRDGFLALSKKFPERIVVINAEKNIKDIAIEIISKLEI